MIRAQSLPPALGWHHPWQLSLQHHRQLRGGFVATCGGQGKRWTQGPCSGCSDLTDGPRGHCRSAPCTPCPPQTWLPWGLREPEPHAAQSTAALLFGSQAQRPVSLGCTGPSVSGVVVVVQTFTLPTSQTWAATDAGEWQATCQLPEQCQPPASRDPTPQPHSPSQALIPTLSRPLEGDRYQSHCTDGDTEEFSGYNRE